MIMFDRKGHNYFQIKEKSTLNIDETQFWRFGQTKLTIYEMGNMIDLWIAKIKPRSEWQVVVCVYHSIRTFGGTQY